MKKRYLIMAALGVAMISTISVNSAMAYFTSTESASGVVEVAIGDSALETNDTAETSTDSITKTVSITNTSSYSCFIRVKAICPNEFTATGAGSDWTFKDDYYVYDKVVEAGASTGDIVFTIDTVGKQAKSFNVIIVQEAAMATYNEDGSATCDWARVVELGQAVESYGSDTDNKSNIVTSDISDTEVISDTSEKEDD